MNAMKAALAVTCAAVLAGCVSSATPLSIQAGKWKDYRDMTRGLAEMTVEKQAAPQDVKDRFAACVADYVMKGFTPAETQRLDAYARGDAELTAGELQHLDDVSKQRMNGSKLTNATLDRFDTTCPQDVPDFRRYLTFS